MGFLSLRTLLPRLCVPIVSSTIPHSWGCGETRAPCLCLGSLAVGSPPSVSGGSAPQRFVLHGENCTSASSAHISAGLFHVLHIFGSTASLRAMSACRVLHYQKGGTKGPGLVLQAGLSLVPSVTVNVSFSAASQVRCH